MSKRRRNLWDTETYEFSNHNPLAHAAEIMGDAFEVEELHEESGEVLDEAHEALSKLFNKSNKRSKHMRGIRRKDAWQ